MNEVEELCITIYDISKKTNYFCLFAYIIPTYGYTVSLKYKLQLPQAFWNNLVI
jgi:hypothetical protein